MCCLTCIIRTVCNSHSVQELERERELDDFERNCKKKELELNEKELQGIGVELIERN